MYLPPILMANIHNLMIMVKKILDLPIPEEQYHNLLILKKISLRILFRIYQKHANPKLTSQL